MLHAPGPHGDGGSSTGIHGPGGPVLGDGDELAAPGNHLVSEPNTLRTKDQAAVPRQGGRLQRHRSGKIVDTDRGDAVSLQPGEEVGNVGMVVNVQVAIGDHRPASIPPSSTQDVHPGHVERIGGAHHRTDVEVVLPVLDGDVQWPTAGVKLGDDRLDTPVPVPINDIASVAVFQQVRVESGILRPRSRSRADPHRSGTRRCTCSGQAASSRDAHGRIVGQLAVVMGTHGCNGTLEAMPSLLITLIPLLMPAWLDPQHIIEAAGAAALWIVALIVFAECGLAVFFMPGDSLLFALGMFAAVGVNSEVPLVHYGSPASTLVIVNIVLIIAAIAGNTVGYWIGHEVGPRLFRPREGVAGKVFAPEHVDKTNEFFEKHGAPALILARFVPLVRTFVTMVGGVAQMNFRKFISYTAIGGVLWVLIAVQAGYFLGQVDVIRNNFEAALLLIIVVSLIPMGVEWLKARRKGAEETTTGDAQTESKAAARAE